MNRAVFRRTMAEGHRRKRRRFIATVVSTGVVTELFVIAHGYRGGFNNMQGGFSV